MKTIAKAAFQTHQQNQQWQLHVSQIQQKPVSLAINWEATSSSDLVGDVVPENTITNALGRQHETSCR